MAPHLQIPGGGGDDDNNRAHPLASSEPGGGISSSEETEEELRGLGRVHVHVEEDLQHTSHTPPLEAADMKNKVVASSEDLLELRCLWPHHTPASHQLATRYESLLGARRRTSASSSPQSALFPLILHAARTYTQTQFATYKRMKNTIQAWEIDVWTNDWVTYAKQQSGNHKADRFSQYSLAMNADGTIFAAGGLGMDVNARDSGGVNVYDLQVNTGRRKMLLSGGDNDDDKGREA